jgi:hypothetical protein
MQELLSPEDAAGLAEMTGATIRRETIVRIGTCMVSESRKDVLKGQEIMLLEAMVWSYWRYPQ